jgi:hypothetical protein
MKAITVFIAFIIVGLILVTTSYATVLNNLSIDSGFEFFRFSFSNYSLSNSQRETADFYGIFLKPKYKISDLFYISSIFSFAYGRGEFTGSSSNTLSSFHHNDSYILLELHPGLKVTYKKFIFKEYLIGGWHELNMYKKASYDEYLHSFYYGLGTEVSYYLSNKLTLGFDVSTRIAPHISSLNHMDQDYSTVGLVKYHMGTGYNYKIGVPIRYILSKNTSIYLSINYSRWHYNSSDTVYINPTMATYEPSYNYHTLGAIIGIGYKF